MHIYRLQTKNNKSIMIGLGTKLLAESQWENTDLFRSNGTFWGRFRLERPLMLFIPTSAISSRDNISDRCELFYLTQRYEKNK